MTAPPLSWSRSDPALADKLRALRDKVTPRCEYAGNRLDKLADAVDGSDSSPDWGAIDTVEWVDPSGTASQFLGQVRSNGLLARTEMFRNLLVLMPILIFWLGLWNAHDTYNRYNAAVEARDPNVELRASTTIFDIWINPPSSLPTPDSLWQRFLSIFDLVTVAQIDVFLIIIILLLTFTVHRFAHGRTEQDANEIEQELRDAACQAGVVLSERASAGEFGKQLALFRQYGRSIESATKDFTGVLTGWKDQVTQLESSAKGLGATVATFNAAGAELKTATGTLSTEIVTMRTTLVGAATKLETAAGAQSTATTTLATAANAIKGEASTLKDAVNDLKATQVAHSNSVTTFNDGAVKLQAAVVNASTVLTSLNTAVTGLGDSTKALTDMREATKEWVDQLAKNATTTTAAAARIASYADSSERRLTAQLEATEKLVNGFETLSDTMTSLSGTMTDIAGFAARAATELETLETRLTNASAHMTEFDTRKRGFWPFRRATKRATAP